MKLPGSWSVATIPALITADGTFCDGDWVESKDQDPDGDVRLIQLADIGDGNYLDKSNRFLTSKKAAELRCTFLQSGDVLIARMPDPLGRACIFPGDEKRSVTVVDVCVVRTGPAYIEHRWLKSFLNAPQMRGKVAALQSGSTRKRISRGNLATIELPLPSTKEQKRIADKVDELFSDLDASVAALERARANLKRYRAAVLKAAVEGRLTAQWRKTHPAAEPAGKLLERILAERRKKWEQAQLAKFAAAGKAPPKGWKDKYPEPAKPDTANLPELPGGWCWATIDQLALLVRNGLAEKPATSPPGFPILRINAVRPMSVDMAEVRYLHKKREEVADYFLANSDLLFTRYNGSIEFLGVSGMVRNCSGDTVHPDKLIRVKTVLTTPMPEFIEVASNVGHSRRHIQGKARTTAGQTGVSGTDIKEAPIPLCSLEEQQQILHQIDVLLSTLSKSVNEIEGGISRASRLRQSILKRAFEGKLVPQDPNDEPASVLLERIRVTRADVNEKLKSVRANKSKKGK